MKTLELELNKRLLIVETTGELETTDIFGYNLRPVKKICKGSDLTESIAEQCVEKVWNGFKNYSEKEPVGNYKRLVVSTALESFTSAIEAAGCHWGENPENKSHFNPEEFIQEEYDRYMESESRTLNPEKCIIFEIL